LVTIRVQKREKPNVKQQDIGNKWETPTKLKKKRAA
jgi:hypothetical protein